MSFHKIIVIVIENRILRKENRDFIFGQNQTDLVGRVNIGVVVKRCRSGGMTQGAIFKGVFWSFIEETVTETVVFSGAFL